MPQTPAEDSRQCEERPGIRGALQRLANGAAQGVCYCVITSSIVWAGVWFGFGYLPPTRAARTHGNGAIVERTGNWDGLWYGKIVREGYSYDADCASNVAFFPAYPSLAALLSRITGLPESYSLLAVSQLSLMATFCILSAYLSVRFPGDALSMQGWTLAAFGLAPATFFFRMQYSEALFLAAVAGTLWSMHRGASLLTVSLIAGFATACRPTGIALLPVVGFYVYQHSSNARQFISRLAFAGPMSCWGIVLYMCFLHASFGDAFAFFRTQEHFVVRPEGSWQARLAWSTALEPIWGRYIPGTATYWEGEEQDIDSPLFSMEFVNPLYFVASALCVCFGWSRKILNSREAILGVFLLAIPYFSHGYRAMMMSEARYAAAAIPVYLVLGWILSRLPPPVAAMCLAISGFFLGVYASLFVAGYRVV